MGKRQLKLFQNNGSMIVETLALVLVFVSLFIGLSHFLRTHRRENPEVLAQHQCTQQMANVSTLFNGLFEKQSDLTDSTNRVDELSYLNDVVYSHANTAARNFSRMWFTEPVITHSTPIKINPAQFKLDATNLAQALYNGDRRYCTEPYGLNTLNGKSIRTWLGDAAPAGAGEIYLKIEPIDRVQHTKIANCQHPLWTAPQGRHSFHDVNLDGFIFDGNSSLGFELTWTAMKPSPNGAAPVPTPIAAQPTAANGLGTPTVPPASVAMKAPTPTLQPQCQIAEAVEHQPDVEAPSSPVLMSITNGNGANLMADERAHTTCDSEEGQFDEIKMTWDFDRPVKPGVLFLCRTWTVYGDAKPELEAASTHASLPREPASSSLNPATAALQMKSSAHPWELCFHSTFEVGATQVPLQMTVQSTKTSTTARMKVEHLPKQDVEYFVEMKLVDQAGTSSPAPATAEFIVDMNRPGILTIQDGKNEDALAEAILIGPTPSNFKDCELVNSDIADAKTCYDGEKCVIRAPNVQPGAHTVELRGRDVCGKLSTTATYGFNQEQARTFASVATTPQLPVALPVSVNACIRPSLRNLSVRCQTAGAWGPWSQDQFRTPASLDEITACEIRFDVIGAMAVQHRGMYDRQTHRDAVFTPTHADAWSTFTEPFPVGYINPKSFYRTEHPLVLYPVGDCFDGQPFTYEMLTSCQQGSCLVKPSLTAQTCMSNPPVTH